MILASLFAEVLVNNRALVVRYEGTYYFPTYGHLLPGTTFGLDYEYETDYRQLAEAFAKEGDDNWVLMPFVPFNAYEIKGKTMDKIVNRMTSRKSCGMILKKHELDSIKFNVYLGASPKTAEWNYTNNTKLK